MTLKTPAYEESDCGASVAGAAAEMISLLISLLSNFQWS